MASSFKSSREFREVLDEAFQLMSEDPEMGSALRDADVPQRFEIEDLDLVVNIRGARPGEPGYLHWEWTDDVDWQPKVRMRMSSDVASRYFQGRENVPIAIARRRITPDGDLNAALALIPVVKPVHARFRAMLADRYPHLVA